MRTSGLRVDGILPGNEQLVRLQDDQQEKNSHKQAEHANVDEDTACHLLSARLGGQVALAQKFFLLCPELLHRVAHAVLPKVGSWAVIDQQRFVGAHGIAHLLELFSNRTRELLDQVGSRWITRGQIFQPRKTLPYLLVRIVKGFQIFPFPGSECSGARLRAHHPERSE